MNTNTNLSIIIDDWRSPVTLNLYNLSAVTLDGSITTPSGGSPTLDVHHGANALSSYGDSLFNELDSEDDTEFSVPDFDVGSDTHEAHVWEEPSAGNFTKWSRDTDKSVSGSRSAMDIDVWVVAVAPGYSAPSAPTTSGPPPAGTTQKKIRVKVEKQGELPFT